MQDVNLFLKDIDFLIETNQHFSAKNQILKILREDAVNREIDSILLIEIAGYLIDIGSEILDKESAEIGVSILEGNQDVFKNIVTLKSYYYCLANGKDALCRIRELGFPSIEVIKNYLLEVKDLYYKSFKGIDWNELENLDLCIITNFANTLNRSGRFIDAIKLFQTVLRNDPNFSQALIGYAETLDCWMRFSHAPQTIALYSEIYRSLERALKNGSVPAYYERNIKKRFTIIKNALLSSGYNIKDLPNDLHLTSVEYDSHDGFRKFCLDNHLTLNEHSIYCSCVASSNDDLAIGHEHIFLNGNNLLKMELLLNRLKSEFHIARKNYYESINELNVDRHVIYYDIQDNEEIRESSEKLRLSFRLCFGILDKIANGICYYLNLKLTSKENIYFESFWKNDKFPKRWDTIKPLENLHLGALYGIASDLNSKNGEFSFYKEWRNNLEHTNLILKKGDFFVDPNKLFNDVDFVKIVQYDYFKEQALYMLQLCRAAIFSFTYFIRQECFVDDKGEGDGYQKILPRD